MRLALLVSLLAAMPWIAGCAAFSSTPPRPNVILIITDDQGYGEVGAHGNPKIRTPNLDDLHAQSVRLTDFHVDPTCSPTRSALMSGRYSSRTGVWHTIIGRSLMSPDEWTIAEALGSAGYRTGMFGKWHLGENYPLRPQDQGFDEVVCHGGGGVGQGPDYWGNDYFDDTYWRDGVPEKFEGYCTDVWFREARRFIDENHDRPFFCYLSTNAPHGPFLVGEEWSQPYVEQGVHEQQAKFYGMIENIDANLGKLVAQLDELGIADNTILVFMTDNGSAAPGMIAKNKVAEDGWRGFDGGMRGRKGSEYDGGHRVPFFVRWPAGGIGGGRDEAVLSAHVDVLPTLAELCGVTEAAPNPLDGTSLAARLRDADVPLEERTLLVHSQRIKQPKKWRKCAVMTERWRLVNGVELYDIVADPKQQNDIASEHGSVVQQLRGEYDAWWESLQPVFAESVRIGIGHESELLTTLHAHDWQVIGNKGCPWHQNHVRRGLPLHGEWKVDVVEAGTYEFELRRWPAHVDESIEATKATLRVGREEQQQDLAAGATHATFRLELPAGPTTVRGILEGEKSRGPYFVYVRRVR